MRGRGDYCTVRARRWLAVWGIMPYTMFIYREKDVECPTVGDLFEVVDVKYRVLDLSIGGGYGSCVVLRPAPRLVDDYPHEAGEKD